MLDLYVLSEKQVDYILKDIRRNGIQTEELQFNLLDHICCVIENEMSSEDSFDEFYRSVLSRFFKKELKEIQEETDLLLTFKNYYTMKKIMLRSGMFSAITFIIGSILRVMHWPGAGFLLVLAIFVASFIFLPLFFLIKMKEVKATKEKFIIGFGVVFGILFCISTMFKIMHWPGADMLWFTGLSVLFFMFLPLFFFSGIRNPETKLNTILSTIMVVVTGGLLFTLSNTQGAKLKEEAMLMGDNQLVSVNQSATISNNERYVNCSLDSNQIVNSTLKNRVEKVVNLIEATKRELFICATYGTKKSEKQVLKDNIGNFEVVNLYFFKSENGAIDGAKPKPHLLKLKEELMQFKQFVEEKYTKSTSEILNLGEGKKKYHEDFRVVTWEFLYFNAVPFEVAVRNLNQLLLNVRLIEASCIR